MNNKNQETLRRGFIASILVIMFLTLFWRISSLHLNKVNNEQTLRDKGIYQSIKPVIVKGYRGNILDRNNKIMALSVPLKNIIIDPQGLVGFLASDYLEKEKEIFIKNYAKLLKRHNGISKKRHYNIAKLLNLSVSNLNKRIQKSGILQQVVITKNTNNLLARKLKQHIHQYYIMRVDTIFDRGINKKIIAKITTALQISSYDLKYALRQTQSAKYLKIKVNLELDNAIFLAAKTLRRQKQRVFYRKKNGKVRYDDKYFGSIILLESQSRRYYPQADAAAALLGLTNINNHGVEGVEKVYNKALSAKDGKKLMAFAGDKEPYSDVKMLTLPIQGKDIMLTIDSNVQYFAYNALKDSVQSNNADFGSAIVLHPNGEILAMANYPSINPNNRNDYQSSRYRNRILLDVLEAGSTMKPFTALFAFEKNRITQQEEFGLTKTIGHTKYDNKYKKLNIEQIIQKSHNLGILNVGERLKKQEIWQMLSKLRFGQLTGATPELSSYEKPGILKHFKHWYLSDKRALSYGYGPMNTTLAQLARAYLVFLNKGKIVDLSLIKNEVKEKKYQQIFNKKAITKMVTILDATVSDEGSGYAAQIKGIDVAGKTGTTRLLKKNSKGYDKGRHGTFFVGFAPSYNPQYLMIVHISNPKGKKQSGSNVAAPVFQKAMNNILKFKS